MPANRASRGIPVPTIGQWLAIAAAVGAAWLIWWELQGPPAGSGARQGGDADEDSRAAALENLRLVEAVAQSGPDGVPELVDGLANSDPRMRRNALYALRLIGPDAGEALAPIRDRLADEDAQVRSYAIDAYWYISRDPDDVAAVLTPMLGDSDVGLREATAKVLEAIGPPAIGPVVELLNTSAPATRVPALKVLRRIGWEASQPQIEDVLRRLVRDGDPDVHAAALWTLGTWGRPTPGEIRELLKRDEAVVGMRPNLSMEPGPREAALNAIIRQGSGGAEFLDDVVQVLDVLANNNRGGPEWTSALVALRALKSAALPAAPRLLQLANKYHGYRWIDVAWILLTIGVDPQEIVCITVPRLLDRDTDTCFHAGRLCALADPDEARRQVSRLIPLLVPEENAGVHSALDAVWGLAPAAQEAIPALSRLLECERGLIARVAAKTLAEIGPEAAPAIPSLVAQLARRSDAHDDWDRRAFCQAIGTIGPAARAAVPVLLAELNDAPLAKLSVRSSKGAGPCPAGDVLIALARIGDPEPAVLAAVRRHLANEDDIVQISAIRALTRLIPESPEVVTCHVEWLRDYAGRQNRIPVILGIGQLPGDREEAVALLSGLLTDSDAEIRKAAAWSLGKIGGGASAALPSLKEVLKDRDHAPRASDKFQSAVQHILIDDPRTQLDRRRWSDLEDPSVDGLKDPRLQEKSVHEVVRQAVAEMEAGSKNSDPLADRNAPVPASLPWP